MPVAVGSVVYTGLKYSMEPTKYLLDEKDDVYEIWQVSAMV